MCIETIRQEGDPLERAIFHDEEFCKLFAVYPVVWKKRVLPNRCKHDPTNVKQEVELFAIHHYSSIIRAWGAYESWRRLGKLLEPDPRDVGEVLLDLHTEFLHFVASARSASELLAKATLEVGTSLGKKTKDIIVPAEDGREWFQFIRLMRNDLLHYKAMLIRHAGSGDFEFDKSVIALDHQEEHQKYWRDGSNEYLKLDAVCKSMWEEFVSGMAHMWNQLDSAIDSLGLSAASSSSPRVPDSYSSDGLSGTSAAPSNISPIENQGSGIGQSSLGPEQRSSLD